MCTEAGFVGRGLGGAFPIGLVSRGVLMYYWLPMVERKRSTKNAIVNYGITVAVSERVMQCHAQTPFWFFIRDVLWSV